MPNLLSGVEDFWLKRSICGVEVPNLCVFRALADADAANKKKCTDGETIVACLTF